MLCRERSAVCCAERLVVYCAERVAVYCAERDLQCAVQRENCSVLYKQVEISHDFYLKTYQKNLGDFKLKTKYIHNVVVPLTGRYLM